MSKDQALAALAINGGTPACSTTWPARHLFGDAEKQAAIDLFDQSIASGTAFGYNGPEEAAYCREFADYLGGGFADAVNSGTTAVSVALRSLDLEPFTEVIVPPVSDPGGFMPVPLMGCIPVPADAAPGTYNAGAEQIAARITKYTSAILVAHIAGTPCDMDPIMDLASRHNLPVVEDCAQSHGATYKGRMVGTFGEVAAFSTMFGKHHASGGQGGIVFTKSEERYRKVRWMSDRGKPFGLPAGSTNVIAALNHNNDELGCAIGRVQLRKLPDILARRRAFVSALANEISALKTISLIPVPANSESAWWFLQLTLDLSKLTCDRDTFVTALAHEGVNAGGSYLHTINQADWYQKRRVFGTSGFPWTDPQYKGNPDALYNLPNIIATDAAHIRIMVHENCDPTLAKQTAAALAKVEAAYSL